MAVTIKELLQDEYFMENFRLLAGYKGLANKVTWFYIAVDASSGRAMPGAGELLILQRSFTELAVIEQIDYIDECRKRRVPGIVFMGSLEEGEKTKLILEYAEKEGFPIFCVENHLELVGITKQLAAALIYDDDRDGRIRSFMQELLNDDEMPLSLVLRRGLSCDINLRYPFFLVSLGFEREKGSEEKMLRNVIRFRDNLGYIFSELERICKGCGGKIITYGSGWQAFCLIGLEPEGAAAAYESITLDIEGFLDSYSSEGALRIIAGISELCLNAERIKLYCRQSERALEYISGSKLSKSCISFERLGIMRFICYLSEAEKYEIIEQAKAQIKPLTEADQSSNADYVKTYRAYFFSKGALKDVADSLYIHHNTLLKRLEKIEKLLGKDIHDPYVKNEAINVFFVLDYFGITGN